MIVLTAIILTVLGILFLWVFPPSFSIVVPGLAIVWLSVFVIDFISGLQDNYVIVGVIAAGVFLFRKKIQKALKL